MWGCLVDGTGERDDQISLTGDSVWRCNFCQRQIREGLLLCPFCGRRISSANGPQRRWYHSRYAVMMSIATLGPFALPILWSNPRYTVRMKVTLTVLTLALTVLLVCILVMVCARLMEQLRQLTTAY
ncbi:MAG: hypothetical protein EHM35_08895 [Planctomycetaceae bacterium]|nr:MAG: hypothetical protein EHM35_08895 [Planctomycetaceae bacterium]